MAKIQNLCGQRFEKLTVLELMPERQERYALYRCRCDCGATVMVNSKRLRRGTVRACPACQKRPLRVKQEDFIGCRFGKLTVESLIDAPNGGTCLWRCRCDCGHYRNVKTWNLHAGLVKSCGCDHPNFPYRDLTGQKFGMLTVLERDGSTPRGSSLWKCRCACGTEKRISENDLVHNRTVSCGCYRKTVLPLALNEHLHHVDGTCVEFLQRKMRSDNTSGYTGVRQLKSGKFTAFITFKKQHYHLGTFNTLEEAVQARRRGEEMHNDFLEQYYREHPDLKYRRSARQSMNCQ